MTRACKLFLLLLLLLLLGTENNNALYSFRWTYLHILVIELRLSFASNTKHTSPDDTSLKEKQNLCWSFSWAIGDEPSGAFTEQK